MNGGHLVQLLVEAGALAIILRMSGSLRWVKSELLDLKRSLRAEGLLALVSATATPPWTGADRRRNGAEVKADVLAAGRKGNGSAGPQLGKEGGY